MKIKFSAMSLIILISLFLPSITLSMNSIGYFNRGKEYYDEGRHAEAIQDFNKAIELNPKYTKAYNNRGFIYYVQGDYAQAIQDYGKAIESNNRYGEAYNNMAWLYTTAKDANYRDGTKAVEFALMAVKLINNIATLDTLGAAYVENKQYEKAIKTYMTVIEKGKSWISFYQKSLKEKGYYSGPIDGISNQELENAIRSCVLEGNYL